MSSAPKNPSIFGIRPEIGVRTRIGKGAHKGANFHIDQRGKKNNYVKDEFLPEDDRAEPLPQGRGVVHIVHKGNGRQKGSGGSYAGTGGGGSGPGGSSGGGGGCRRSDNMR